MTVVAASGLSLATWHGDDDHLLPLIEQWQSCSLAADVALSPEQAVAVAAQWHSGLNPFDLDNIPPAQRENRELWCRCHFSVDQANTFFRSALIFEGLATVADLWLNGSHILHSDNMFLRHEIDVSELLVGDNKLYIRFHALTPKLEQRKPRPKWRTAFANHKNIAWFRTSLLGRIPTWSPPPPIIGPWLPVALRQQKTVRVENLAVDASLDGTRGIVELCCNIRMAEGKKIDSARLCVGNICADLDLDNATAEGLVPCRASVTIDGIELWWPHTHGDAKLYPLRLYLVISGRELHCDLDPVGFRQFEWRNLDAALQTKGEFTQDFGLSVNGEKIFCRGACWTPLDIHRPASSEAELRRALELLRDAGVNMLRVSGTFFYEQDIFYRLCDELGILVWQDFMFARLAYPFEDATFAESVLKETGQVIMRLRARASTAIFCGNTEVEQQTAMLGLPLDEDFHTFFRVTLAEQCAQLAPHVAYWPSSPAGGDMPFKITQGVSHYFGVGGYMRGLDDAQVNPPQFASECLAFSNVPENRGIAPFLPDQAGFPTHPDYKAGVPRDVSSGWDFADISDHYLERLFGVDSRALRFRDPQRYFALSRVCTGEVMSRVMGLWRRKSSPCNGALLWLLRDLQLGAGWGIIDAEGLPKSPYYYLKRLWSPLALWFVDEGLNGLSLVLDNETGRDLVCRLELLSYQENGKVALKKDLVFSLSARSQQRWNVERLLGSFFDVSYAYRFGPEVPTLVHARLHDGEGSGMLAEAFYYRTNAWQEANNNLELRCSARRVSDCIYDLTISSEQFARAVVINAHPYLPDDNYFDLAPGAERTVTLRSSREQSLRGTVSALNSIKVSTIELRDKVNS